MNCPATSLDLKQRQRAFLSVVSAIPEFVQVLDWNQPRHNKETFILLSGDFTLQDIALVNMARRNGIFVLLDLACAPKNGDQNELRYAEITQAMRRDVALWCRESRLWPAQKNPSIFNTATHPCAVPTASHHRWAEVITMQLRKLRAYVRANKPQALEMPLTGEGNFYKGFKASRRAIAFSVSARAHAPATAEPEGGQLDPLYQALRAQYNCTLSPLRKFPPAVDSPQAVVIINLKQDLDLALPIMLAVQRQGVSVQAWLSSWAAAKSPRISESLGSAQLDFIVLPNRKPERWITKAQQKNLRYLLAITETNLPIHDFGMRLVKWANKAGIQTATMQHGLENVGLTYSDHDAPIKKVRFQSRHIFIWGRVENLHPLVNLDTRRKCISVGYPKHTSASLRRIPMLERLDRPIIGIFENLHWSRYNERYRRWFVSQLTGLARLNPGMCFLLKPHHAGIWTSSNSLNKRPNPANIILADPLDAAWEPFTAEQLLAYTAAVITTPSTVALDAASKSIPVAVVAEQLELDFYQPLPLLREPWQWAEFLSKAATAVGRTSLIEKSQLFYEKCVVPGHSADLIAGAIGAAARWP